jgi:hypothetical protein
MALSKEMKKLVRDRLLTEGIANDITNLFVDNLFTEDNMVQMVGIISLALIKLKRSSVSVIQYQNGVRKMMGDLEAFSHEVFEDVFLEIVEPQFINHSERQVNLIGDTYDVPGADDETDNTYLTTMIGRIPLSEWYSKLPATFASLVIKSALAADENNEDIPLDLIKSKTGQNFSMFAYSSLVGIAESAIVNVLDGNKYDQVYTAIMDLVTTFQCAKLNGKEFPFGVGPIPPIHHGCRSQRLPKKKGESVEMESFDEWFNGESDEFHRLYLGKSRYDMYKSGKLSLNDFVSPDLKTYTIKELNQLQG